MHFPSGWFCAAARHECRAQHPTYFPIPFPTRSLSYRPHFGTSCFCLAGQSIYLLTIFSVCLSFHLVDCDWLADWLGGCLESDWFGGCLGFCRFLFDGRGTGFQYDMYLACTERLYPSPLGCGCRISVLDSQFNFCFHVYLWSCSHDEAGDRGRTGSDITGRNNFRENQGQISEDICGSSFSVRSRNETVFKKGIEENSWKFRMLVVW